MTVEISYSAQAFDTNRETGESTPTGQLYTLVFDAVASEKTGLQASLTEHAVEGDAAINDHKYTELRTVTLECIVSNTPLGPPPLTGSRSQTIDASTSKVDLGDGMSAQALVYSRDIHRVADVLAELEDLVRKPITVTVVTSLKAYEDMTLVRVSPSRDASDGDAVTFDIELKEVRRARTETTTAPQPRRAINRPVADRGGRRTTEPDAETAAAAERAARMPRQSGFYRLTH